MALVKLWLICYCIVARVVLYRFWNVSKAYLARHHLATTVKAPESEIASCFESNVSTRTAGNINKGAERAAEKAAKAEIEVVNWAVALFTSCCPANNTFCISNE